MYIYICLTTPNDDIISMIKCHETYKSITQNSTCLYLKPRAVSKKWQSFFQVTDDVTPCPYQTYSWRVFFMTVDSDRKKLSTSDREFRCNDANPNVFSLINVTEQPPTRQLPVPTKSGLLQNKGS